jgi:hypothetical protein
MHRIHPNFQTARSKFYDECLAGDLGVAELNGLLKIML